MRENACVTNHAARPDTQSLTSVHSYSLTLTSGMLFAGDSETPQLLCA